MTAGQMDPTGSPGVMSGNVVQVPTHIPVNIAGVTMIDGVIGVVNPASGNVSPEKTAATGAAAPTAPKK